MGRIKVEGLGIVEIEGDAPTERESSAIRLAVQKAREPIETGRPSGMPKPQPVQRPGGKPMASPGQATVEPFAGPGQRPGIKAGTGAPAGVRATVGTTRRKPEDRLATLRKFFPDAQPMGEDNFVFTNPKTGQKQVLNPEGMEAGDIAEYGREITEFVGGGLGAAAGAPLGIAGTAAGAGLGGEAAGQVYDYMRRRFGGMVDTRKLEEMAAQSAGNIAAGAAGQRVGEFIGGVPGRIKNYVGREILGKSPEAAERLARMQEADIPLGGTAAAVSQARPVQMATEVVGGMPIGARRINRETQRTLDDIDDKLQSVFTRVGGELTEAAGAPLTKEAAGEAVIKGGKEAAKRFSTRAGKLVEELNQHMGGVRVKPDNVLRAVEDLTSEMAEAPQSRQYINSGLREARRIIDDLDEGGTIPFKALTDLRTDLRGKLMRPDISGYLDKEAQAVSKIRQALKDDIIDGATRKGPETAKARAVRDRYISMMREDRMPFLDDVERKKAQDIVNFAMQNTKRGADQLRKFKKTLDPSTYKDLAATGLHELGRMGGEEFDTSRFFREYGRLSNEAREQLFSGANMGPLKKELDNLHKVIADTETIKEVRNFSKTAMNNYYFQLLGGLGAGGAMYGATGDPQHGAAAFGAAMLTPAVTAKLLTSPGFVRWLGTAVKGPSKTMISSGGHLGRLGDIASEEPAIADEISQFVNLIKQNPPPEFTEGGASPP